MARRSLTSGFAFFLIGLGCGAALAMLYAPRSGEETRELINEKVEAGKTYVAARKQEFQRKAEDLATVGRRKAEDLAEKGKAMAAKVGLQAS
ncbi:MAG: YtxH domain-containing protein [Terriglobia bacterium]